MSWLNVDKKRKETKEKYEVRCRDMSNVNKAHGGLGSVSKYMHLMSN